MWGWVGLFGIDHVAVAAARSWLMGALSGSMNVWMSKPSTVAIITDARWRASRRWAQTSRIWTATV